MRSQSYLTQPSGAGGSKGGIIPVTTRNNLESLIRLSQARAKMKLRDYVSEKILSRCSLYMCEPRVLHVSAEHVLWNIITGIG